MSITVDQKSLAADELGLQTVGQVLNHLQQENRLVVNLLIDGERPDLSQIGRIRQSAVMGKTLFIETVRPREMAVEVLDEVEAQLAGAEKFKTDAAELLQQNQLAKAMEKLGLCFSTWNSARESVLKISQLLRIDLERIRVGGQTLVEALGEFTAQLRLIKDSLTGRDFVLLSDVLLYETTQTNQRWLDMLAALRAAI